jgi:tRNA A-37 threonylcarbamoyl transferase component Bud32
MIVNDVKMMHEVPLSPPPSPASSKSSGSKHSFISKITNMFDSSSSSSKSVKEEGTQDDLDEFEFPTTTDMVLLSELDRPLNGPYLEELKVYFKNPQYARFGREILLKQPYFFTPDVNLLDDIDGSTNSWTLIGNGSFSNVYKTYWKGNLVALKVCNKYIPERGSFALQRSDSVHEGLHSIFEEYTVSKQLRHPYIVTMFAASPHMLVLEYMHYGALDRLIRKNDKQPPPITIRRWVSQITSAIKYMHSMHIVHSDVKLDNIFVDEYSNCKIGDMGAAYFELHDPKYKIVTDTYLPLSFYSKSHDFELQKKIGYDTDLYALSVVIICIASWHESFMEILDIQFIERRLHEAKDITRRKYIMNDICINAIHKVWAILDASPLSNTKSIEVFQWFIKYSVEDGFVDKETKALIEKVTH